MVIHLVVITLIYAVCFWTGRHMGMRPDPEDIKFYDVIKEASQSHNVHPALIAAGIHA